MNRILAGEAPKWARDEARGRVGGDGFGYCIGSAFGYGYTEVVGFSNGEGLWAGDDPFESSGGQGQGRLFNENNEGGNSNPYSKVEVYKKRRKPVSE